MVSLKVACWALHIIALGPTSLATMGMGRQAGRKQSHKMLTD